MARFQREYEEIVIGRVVFNIEWRVYKKSKRPFLVGYRMKTQGIPTFVGISPPKVLKPDNRSFFLVTRMLYTEGYLDEIVELFRRLGFNVTPEELSAKYEEAIRYAKEMQEKWERIKKAWGLSFI